MMQLKNTSAQYGLFAIILHWIIAILIIFLIALGLYMTYLPVSLNKLKYYGIHKEVGMLVFMLVVIRLAWRFLNLKPTLASLSPWERVAARTVHYIFYIWMIVMPVTGWLITSAAGLPVSFFHLFIIPNITAPNDTQLILFSTIHTLLGYILIGIIGLHTAAAMKHHFIEKDDILRRIL